MSEVRNYPLLNAEQQLELKHELSQAKTREEKENIFNAYMQRIQAENAPQEQQAPAAVEKQATRLAKEQIDKLPPEYQQAYYAANNDEAKQKEVIMQYYSDKKYFPDKTTTVSNGENVFGNRNFTKKEGGVELSTKLTKLPLVDGDGKPIEQNVEARFETVKGQFQKQMDDQLAAIDNNTKLTEEQKTRAKDLLLINEALNTSLKPQVKILADEIKKELPTTNKNTYYQLAMSQDEKNAVNKRSNEIRNEMMTLIKKPENQLTAEEKAKLEKYKSDFNAKFPEDEAFRENEHLWDLNKVQNKEVKKAAYEKLDALAKMMAIEEQIGGVELTAEQREKLAKAKMTEAVTHENEIIELSTKRSLTKDPEELKKIDKSIKTLMSNKDKMLKDIRKGRIADQAQAQVEFETYKQNFENTKVHWDEKDAKQAEKEDPAVNNTHLNKYAQNIIKKNPSAYCDSVSEAEADFFTENEDGTKSYWKLNSDMYKKEMLRIANSQAGYDDTKIDGDYYASTSEWADFADKYAKKGEGRPATMGERRDARKMFAAAGIQVAPDKTYAMRAKEMTKAGLAGAGAGFLAALGGELLEAGKRLNYNGTAYGIAKGIASTTINGIASTTVTGMANGTVNGVAHGSVDGVASTTVTGSVSDTVSGTVNSLHESIVQKYNPNTGKYITVGHQTTEIPVSWSKDVTLNYSQNVSIPYHVDVSLPYQQDVSIPYSQDVNIEYQKNVDIPYEQKDVPAEYNGNVKDKFDWGNIAKGTVIGAVTGVGLKGLKYLFKRKEKSDYVSDDNVKDAIRSNTGYEKKAEQTVTVPAEDKNPVKALNEKIVIERKVVKEEIPQERYKLQAKETIGAVICGKYGVKFNSPEYKAILKYVRETANGLKNGEIPTGDEYNLPAWIPGDVIAAGHDNIELIKDGEVEKTDYEKIAYNSRDAKNSGTYDKTILRSTTQQGSDIWNPDGTKRKPQA